MSLHTAQGDTMTFKNTVVTTEFRVKALGSDS